MVRLLSHGFSSQPALETDVEVFIAAWVGQNIGEILTKLEGSMQIKAPHILAELKQGLSDAEIAALEYKSGIRLPDDVKALYRWHNGSATRNP
jgi:cell wall assembly regulator SMI1